MDMKTYHLQRAGCLLFLGYTFLFDLIEKIAGHKLPFAMVLAAAALYFAALSMERVSAGWDETMMAVT